MKGLIKIIIFIIGSVGFGYALFATIPSFSNWAYLWIILTGLWLCAWLIGVAAHRDSIKKEKAKAEIEALPLLTEAVTVISKFHEKDVSGSLGFTDTKNAYFIVFELPDKSREKFAVTSRQYALIREGETGILSYRRFGTLPDNIPEEMLEAALQAHLIFVDFRGA